MLRRTTALLSVLWFAPICQAGLFDNQEQQAGKLFQQGKYEAAAEKFTDSYRRGVAQYRAGQYGQAAESFNRVQRENVRTDALYNLGNSRFQEGRLEAAAEAYRQVLLREPDYEDARHNLGLTSAMLAETSQEEEKRQRKQDKREQKDKKEQKEQKKEKQQQSEDQQSEQQQSSDEQQKQDKQQSDDEQSEQQQSSGDQQEQKEQQQSGDEQSEQQQSSGDQSQQQEQQGQKQDEQQQTGSEQPAQQQKGEDDPSETQLNGDQEERSAQGSDDTEQAAEVSEDGRSGDQLSDSGNDEQAQDRHSAFGEDLTIEDRGRGEQADDDSTGSPQQVQAGEANDPRDFDPARANRNSGAIEQFDQLGRPAGREDEDAAQPGEFPDAGRRSTVIVMEQLLDQVEGNPAHLMRNQFMLEEQRMNQNGGRMYEPRPW